MVGGERGRTHVTDAGGTAARPLLPPRPRKCAVRSVAICPTRAATTTEASPMNRRPSAVPDWGGDGSDRDPYSAMIMMFMMARDGGLVNPNMDDDDDDAPAGRSGGGSHGTTRPSAQSATERFGRSMARVSSAGSCSAIDPSLSEWWSGNGKFDRHIPFSRSTALFTQITTARARAPRARETRRARRARRRRVCAGCCRGRARG